MALTFCLWGVTRASAQSRLPLVISGGTHSLTVPWHTGPLAARFNLALSLGTERTLKRGRHLTLLQTASLEFFQEHWWMTGVAIDTGLGLRRRLPAGLTADLQLGAGYLHYFWRRQTLVLQNGEYVEARDWGRPSLMIPLSLVLGYRGSRDRPPTVSPFVSARWAAQVLFRDEVPAMTHFTLSLGVRISRSGPAASSGGD